MIKARLYGKEVAYLEPIIPVRIEPRGLVGTKTRAVTKVMKEPPTIDAIQLKLHFLV
jgi:hypothetical protein